MPFRGSGPALNALIAGQVDYVCDQTVGIVPSIQGGNVKGWVVATPDRLAQLPDMPTSKEQGLPEFQAVGWNALFAPKDTPKAMVDKLNAAARAALKDEQRAGTGSRISPPTSRPKTNARRNGSAVS